MYDDAVRELHNATGANCSYHVRSSRTLAHCCTLVSLSQTIAIKKSVTKAAEGSSCCQCSSRIHAYLFAVAWNMTMIF